MDFNITVVTKRSVGFRRWLKSNNEFEKYRIKFYLGEQHSDPWCILSYYLTSKHVTFSDARRMHDAIRTQFDRIWFLPRIHDLVSMIVEETTSTIQSSRAWHYDFSVRIKYTQVPRQEGADYVLLLRRSVPTFYPRRANELATEMSKVMTSGNEEQCVICLEEIPAGSEAVSLPCKHPFHGDCIEEWLRTGDSCPVCRFKMPTSSSNTLTYV